MSKIDSSTMPALADPLDFTQDFSAFDVTSPGQSAGALVPMNGMALMSQSTRVTTAQRVAVERDLAKVMRTLGQFCATFGDKFVYSWEVNDNKNRRKQVIEGGTIQMANTLVRCWGNCAVECDVNETPTHWIFKAFFMDYESGVTVSRLFQQRKKNSMGGRYDDDRALDMVFQVGQSKAIRNVILNALSDLRDSAIVMSKQAVVRKFTGDGEQAVDNRRRAWEFIEKVCGEHGIDMAQIEAVRGRKADKFLVTDLARTFAEIKAIAEGMADPAEVYPTPEDAKGVQDEKDDRREDDRQNARQRNPSGRGRGGKGKDKDDGQQPAGASGTRSGGDSNGAGDDRRDTSEASQPQGNASEDRGGSEEGDGAANAGTDSGSDDAVAGEPDDGRDGGGNDVDTAGDEGTGSDPFGGGFFSND